MTSTIRRLSGLAVTEKAERPWVQPFALFTILLGLVLSAGASNNAAAASQNSLSTDDYINTLGELTALENTNVLRAQAIFLKLTQVTDRISGSHIRLVVVESDTRPWAIAVPDGGIILSKGALDFCYKDSPEVGDTRLAFVLGHELSHLTARDFWHQDVHLQFATRPDEGDVNRIRETLARAAGVSSDADVNDFLVRLRERELAADDNGFLIAAIAGYNVDTLVNDTDSNFLHQWVNATGGYSEISHFSANERTAFLRQRLQRLRRRSILFDVGVRLGFSGYTSEAIRLLHEFEQDFPSKQVFNNLGYFYLVSAIASMPESIGSKWWFPVIATMEIPSSVQSRSIGGVGARATALLEKARKYLELAVQADASYVTALLNLASTEYFLDNPHAARAHVESARKIDPYNIHAAAVQAPLLVAQNPGIDMSGPALSLLKDLVQRPEADESVWYNYARLLEATGDKEQADTVWTRLIDGKSGLPVIFDRVACERLSREEGCSLGKKDEVDSSRHELARFSIGSSIEEESMQRLLAEWDRQSYETDVGVIEIFKDSQGHMMVSRDSVVIFVAVRRSDAAGDKILISDLGKPRFEVALASGMMRQYADSFSVFSDGPIIREFWYSKH